MKKQEVEFKIDMENMGFDGDDKLDKCTKSFK